MLKQSEITELLLLSSKNDTLSGIIKWYYETGELKYEAIYRDNKENGLSKTYYKSGELEAEENYTEGKRDGFTKIYSKLGILLSKHLYKHGEENGKARLYYESGELECILNFKNGNVIAGLFYRKNGTVLKKMTYEDLCCIGLGEME